MFVILPVENIIIPAKLLVGPNILPNIISIIINYTRSG